MLSRRDFLEITFAGALASHVEPTQAQGEMPYRTLGKTGAKVSLLGLGGAHTGTQKDEAESIRIIRTAIDSGVNFLDNCWDYNDGQSEIRMGKALRDGYREQGVPDDEDRRPRRGDGRRSRSTSRCKRLADRPHRSRADARGDPGRRSRIAFRRGRRHRGDARGEEGGQDPLHRLHRPQEPGDPPARCWRPRQQHGFLFDTVQMPLNVMDAHFNSFEQQVLPVLVHQGIGVLAMKSLGDHFILDSKTGDR